jgi:undecaprenyl-diphosphatase
MWAATAAWRARHTGPERAQAVRALTIAGIESTIVNRALKLVVGRSRPDPGLELTAAGVPVRPPSSSSFPSGHTLAAFCAVTVMSRPGDPAGNALLFGAASLVGLSRLHLRAHHASDVLGGAAIGMALGVIGRRFL